MKTHFSILLLLFSDHFFAQNATAVLGSWKAEDDSSKQIVFFKGDDGFIYGKTKGESSDGKMPGGHLLFQRIWFDEKQKNWHGTMHPPGENFSAETTISLGNGGKMTVTMRKFLISKSLHFLPVN